MKNVNVNNLLEDMNEVIKCLNKADTISTEEETMIITRSEADKIISVLFDATRFIANNV